MNVSYSEKMCTLEELSTMTVDSSESNPKISEDSNLGDSMWHILSFEIVRKSKFMFWCGLW